jgi:Tat protein secretion system quality control protein TatD with DNase activity
VVIVAEKIAEVKKIDFDEVWKKCGENAIKFFKLTI